MAFLEFCPRLLPFEIRKVNVYNINISLSSLFFAPAEYKFYSNILEAILFMFQ